MVYFWGMGYFKNLAGLLLLLFALESCSQPKALVYQDIQNFRVQKADLQQATIVTDLRFYNPNGYSLDLKDGDLKVYFGERYVGNAVLDERTKVPAKGTFLLPVSITAGLQSIFVNALDILTNKEVLVRLEGSIKAGKGRIFVRVPVRYEGRQRIEL